MHLRKNIIIIRINELTLLLLYFSLLEYALSITDKFYNMYLPSII